MNGFYYKLAYRSNWTDWEWVELYNFSPIGYDSTLHSISIWSKSSMQHCEFGIFGMNEGASYWKDRRPRRIFNRQPGPDLPIPSCLGSVIDTMYVLGKNPR